MQLFAFRSLQERRKTRREQALLILPPHFEFRFVPAFLRCGGGGSGGGCRRCCLGCGNRGVKCRVKLRRKRPLMSSPYRLTFGVDSRREEKKDAIFQKLLPAFVVAPFRMNCLRLRLCQRTEGHTELFSPPHAQEPSFLALPRFFSRSV